MQDIFLTRTAELADVVLPATATWCEEEGTFTNSERRVQRVRAALAPPGNARDDLWIVTEIAPPVSMDGCSAQLLRTVELALGPAKKPA